MTCQNSFLYSEKCQAFTKHFTVTRDCYRNNEAGEFEENAINFYSLNFNNIFRTFILLIIMKLENVLLFNTCAIYLFM